MSGKLYLIPSPISEESANSLNNIQLKVVISAISDFIVEDVKTARRFLKKINPEIEFEKISFSELNEHTKPEEIYSMLEPIKSNKSIGLMSEAGCPGIADPGQNLVFLAHQKNIEVVPLIGASSIFLALMASGLNGQNFTFNGYLPVKSNERIKAIKTLEQRSLHENQTQIFIETPYRNLSLFTDLIQVCQSDTLLCVASNLTSENEFIKTMKITEWKKYQPDIQKKPTVFLIHSKKR